MSKTPLHTVLFGMFPNAMKALAEHSLFGSQKHNPGEPLHWAFDKSTQHADCVLSHLAKAGQTDPETGKSHSFAMLWRACALVETELVNAGAEPGFAVRFDDPLAQRKWRVEFCMDGRWESSGDCPDVYSSKAEADAAIAANPHRWSGSSLSKWRAVPV